MGCNLCKNKLKSGPSLGRSRSTSKTGEEERTQDFAIPVQPVEDEASTEPKIGNKTASKISRQPAQDEGGETQVISLESDDSPPGHFTLARHKSVDEGVPIFQSSDVPPTTGSKMGNFIPGYQMSCEATLHSEEYRPFQENRDHIYKECLQNDDNNHESTRRANAMHGHIYQLSLLMLFLYRGVKLGYSFRLGTEIEQANKFDDLVFEYSHGNKKVHRLLQAKHKLDESKKITARLLLSEVDGDYYLLKYFFSYIKTKNDEIFNVIKDVTICTNIDFDFNSLRNMGIDVEKIVDEDDILDVECRRKQPTRYRFSDNILELLKSRLSSQHGRSARQCYTDVDLKDFLNHLVFAVNQPNHEELGEIVKREMGRDFDFTTTEIVYNRFFMRLLNWMQGYRSNAFLSSEEGKKFFQEASGWMEPVWFDVQDPVGSFVGRISELEELYKTFHGDETATSKIVCVSGFGGIGKTEMVRKYINKYSHLHGERVVWINAQNYRAIAESFNRLASDVLKISLSNADGGRKKLVSVIEEVYNRMSNGKNIFVFDNAEFYQSQNEFDEGIDKFLPKLPPQKRPFVIIMSRNRKWPEFVKVLPLKTWKESEAVEFIEKSLKIKSGSQSSDTLKLGRTLGLFPSALEHAVSYIRMQEEMMNVGSRFTVRNYLEIYRKEDHKEQILKFTSQENCRYATTMLMICNDTFEAIMRHCKIKHDNEESEAMKMFRVLSYLLLVRDSINVNTFRTFYRSCISNDESVTRTSLGLLKQYSLVNFENGKLLINQLVKDVTRILWKDFLEEALRLSEGLLSSKYLAVAKDICLFSATVMTRGVYDTSKYYLCASVSVSVMYALLEGERLQEACSFGLKVTKLLKAVMHADEMIYREVVSIGYLIGRALSKLGGHKRALDRFHVVAKELDNHDIPELAELRSYIALSHTELGEFSKALALYQDILDSQNAKTAAELPEALSTKQSIARLYLHWGLHKEALKRIKDNLAHCSSYNYVHPEPVIHNYPEQVLLSLEDLAVVNSKLGDYHEAMRLFQQISELREHPNALSSERGVAQMCVIFGRYDEGLKKLERICADQTAILGKYHRETLTTKHSIANTLVYLCRFDEAYSMLTELHNIELISVGEEHPQFLLTKQNRGRVLVHLHQYDKALEMYQEVIQKGNKILGNTHPDVLSTIRLKGEVLRIMGKLDDALTILLEVYCFQLSILGPEHPDSVDTLEALGMTYYGSKQYITALQTFEGVFERKAIMLGHDHPETLKVSKWVELCRLKSIGNLSKTALCLKQLLDALKKSLGEIHIDVFTIKVELCIELLQRKNYDDFHTILEDLIEKAHIIATNTPTQLSSLGVNVEAKKILELITAIEKLCDRTRDASHNVGTNGQRGRRKKRR